jgi:hypothetical protein
MSWYRSNSQRLAISQVTAAVQYQAHLIVAANAGKRVNIIWVDRNHQRHSGSTSRLILGLLLKHTNRAAVSRSL